MEKVYKMTFRTLWALLLVSMTMLAPVAVSHAQETASQPIETSDPAVTEKDLFNYLDQSILWYRHVATAEMSNISSREMLLRNSLQQSALKSLRYSFDFSRIQASILEEEIKQENAAAEAQTQADAKKPATAEEPVSGANEKPEPEKFNPVQAKINIAAKIDELQKQIAATDTEMARARSAARAALTARRDKLSAELALAKTQDGLIGTIISISGEDKEETITSQIDNLGKAIPELAASKKKTDTSSTAPASSVPAATTGSQEVTAAQATQMLTTGVMPQQDAAAPAPTEAKGIIGLIKEMLARSREKQDLSDLIDETKAMQKANDTKIQEQRERLLNIIQRSRALSQQEAGTATDTLVNQGKELEALNGNFKQVSDLIVPLSKQRISLRNAVQTIENWQSLFTEEMKQIASRLVSRIVSLVLMIVVPFVLSELARRGLSQYIRDGRRRRQLNIIRRVVVGIVIGLIVLLNLVSEFGSMATFIGFVTAGLAVALQNVILSIVAYFFFFGRFGIKIGSRVTANGVIGDVIETGFVRLYLMELTEEKGQYRPTGRIVAFPNSILFQPTPFFKQVPGVGYRWHEMTYTLEKETECPLAETKLREIVEAVYNDNKGMIDMQKAAMEQSTRLRVKEPRPDGKIERNADGLNVVIRYPVDTEQSDTTDKNVMRLANEVFEKIPAVKKLTDEPPVIKRK